MYIIIGSIFGILFYIAFALNVMYRYTDLLIFKGLIDDLNFDDPSDLLIAFFQTCLLGVLVSLVWPVALLVAIIFGVAFLLNRKQ